MTKPEEKPEEVTPKPFTVKYNGKQYAAGVCTPTDDWESIEFEFETIPEEVQICVVSDAVKAEQDWGTEYYSNYIAIEDTKISVNLAEQVTAIGNGATKITGVNLQAKTTTAPDLKVKGAIVTKKDGTKEAVVAVKDWATEVTEN